MSHLDDAIERTKALIDHLTHLDQTSPPQVDLTQAVGTASQILNDLEGIEAGHKKKTEAK